MLSGIGYIAKLTIFTLDPDNCESLIVMKPDTLASVILIKWLMWILTVLMKLYNKLEDKGVVVMHSTRQMTSLDMTKTLC